jgi:myo-inositol-1-phosphate synthase
MVDMIRCAKFALDRGLSGRLESVSAYYAKHPPVQYPDHIAKQMLDDFIAGKRDS